MGNEAQLVEEEQLAQLPVCKVRSENNGMLNKQVRWLINWFQLKATLKRLKKARHQEAHRCQT
eukprot:7860789-Prorocentrum_lima.AAC.1